MSRYRKRHAQAVTAPMAPASGTASPKERTMRNRSIVSAASAQFDRSSLTHSTFRESPEELQSLPAPKLLSKAAPDVDSIPSAIPPASHSEKAAHLTTAGEIIRSSLGDWASGSATGPKLPGQLQNALSLLQQQMAAELAERDRAAQTDLQTGLLNRPAFRQEVEARLAAPEASGRGRALVFIDLDDFRKINDRLGYELGDRILQGVARRLRNARDSLEESSPAPLSILLGRVGGDEFALFLSCEASPEQVLHMTTTVLEAIRKPLDLEHTSVSVGASAGIALVGEHSRQYSTLLDMAELAQREAKSRGGSRIELFGFDIQARAQDRACLEADMRAALEKEQFFLAFQPQMPIQFARTPTAEALIRWNHPERGLLLPASFIPIAEESGLITDIARWVIASGADTIARWMERDIPCRLAINLTTRDICCPDIVGVISQQFRDAGADPTRLEIELTESVLAVNEQDLGSVLQDLRSLGVRIAIDDFGNGYSNLARLLNLPIDRLKIDRSLISSIVSNTPNRTIVYGLILMARSLGYEVVAEGVEMSEQISLLKTMGSCFVQGYAVGRPMPEERLYAWLERYDHAIRNGLALNAATFAPLEDGL